MTVEHAMKCAEADVRIGLAVEPETARVLLDELRRLREPGWVLKCEEPAFW
jgi:hypothetical protein